MITPSFSTNLFNDAVASLRRPVLEGNIGSTVLGVTQGSKTLKAGLDAKGRDLPELLEKSFLLASISKAITATAVARMVDQGVIQWSQPLSKYLPELKAIPGHETILIGDVFTHRTGFGNFQLDKAAGIPSCEAYKLLLTAGLKIQPHTAAIYSNPTFWFINALVHQVLGFEKLEEFLKEWLFQVCDMRQTSFAPAAKQRLDPVGFGLMDLESFMKLELGSAGLWSSVDDLLKLGKAVITPGKLFKEETFQKMVMARPFPKYNEAGFYCRTLGWVKEVNFNDQPEHGFFHGGATGGVLWCDPKADFVWVLVSDKWGADNVDAFHTLELFYEKQAY